ncbi:DEAD/DEAH box helicase [Corynebacterium sp. A21]|uniref:DEAD/DEAH box helicase n=1 Tax=Corynebacterium sp. A21 TaxID=3457318 RepID=UPI003FD2DCD1
MSTLIPVHTADHILEGLTEYLATSFSLADSETSAELKRFLSDADSGMFHGPYVRSRLPYAQAKHWDQLLGWLPKNFVPYHHQAEAFQRLRSQDESGNRRPEPTLVVTGTGSGKTEAFLYPVLDHAARMRKLGQKGVKALLLYPMNALANDQADRLSKLIADNPALSSVTAGIYTGESQGGVKTMSAKSLITDRETMRQDPPDLLLTNYKMLDQLLLRTADREIWKNSADSLQYLVLDEFHTYDGAQGTDVALLLRRLGLRLRDERKGSVIDLEEAKRPLGRVTPVATSATLGADDDFTPMLNFAKTVFGESFPPAAIVSETMLGVEDWRAEIAQNFGPSTQAEDVRGIPDVETIDVVLSEIAEQPQGVTYADHVFSIFCKRIWECPENLDSAIRNFATHELTSAILANASKARPLTRRAHDQQTPLPELVLGATARLLKEGPAAELITHALTAIAYLRAELGARDGWGGKRLPGVETHLWVREVSRIDRAISAVEEGSLFRWSDDGPPEVAEDRPTHWLPACYCRSCGRSGWMVSLEPGTDAPIMAGPNIRAGSLAHPERQRPLLDATAEQRDAIQANRNVAGPRGTEGESAVMWLHTDSRELSTRAPRPEEEESGASIPVLTYFGPEAERFAREQRCPSCGDADSIRFIGSSVATLLSVSLSNLFGMPELDKDEKKTLIFTDSVQDAAHRAGFVQSRSRAFALRTLTRRAVGDAQLTLNQLPDRLMEQAADDPRARFELLPPELVDFPKFKDSWHPDATPAARREGFKHVRHRLSFDLLLEFGQRADLARSLALTGSLTASVSIPEAAARTAADEALAKVAAPTMDLGEGNRRLTWVQGVLEMTRARGGINHPWLESYLHDDGNAYLLNRRQARAGGIPSFPRGGSPEFPRLGPQLTSAARRDTGTTPIGSPRARFAAWTSKLLGLGTQDAANAVARLFEELAQREVLKRIPTNSQGTIFALEPEQVLIDAAGASTLLECEVCHSRSGLATPVRELLEGAPCFTLGCTGRLASVESEDNYYRRLYSSMEPRTVIAREHTSLLKKKDRLALENAFRATDAAAPNAPNVLVATPTLEMGIDIGDLSTVMLASLPTSVASYVQRVGRAGRLTGNSLVLALVQGRGAVLPKLNQPLSVISGSVTPPVAYLSAVEILHRQFTAFLIDSIDTATEVPELRFAMDVFQGPSLETSLVAVITARVRAGIDELLDEFIGSLDGEVDQSTADELRSWATGEGPDSLIAKLETARAQWRDEHKELSYRRTRLEERIDELDLRSDSHDDELKEEKRITLSSLRHVRGQLGGVVLGQHWIAAMERFGLLPNFTLLDDSVELSVAVSKFNPQEMVFDTELFEYSRGVSVALHEFAPGATFYAQGIAATIDSVEIGHQGAAIEQWRLCPECSHSEILLPDGPTPGACPQCGSPVFADKGQIIEVLQLRKVSAEVEQTRSMITDNRDERNSARFHTTVSFVIPEGGQGPGWYLSEGFGVEHLKQVELRWLNLGKGNGEKRRLGGREIDSPLFHVCRHCGHVDSAAGANSKWDHRPWCPHRTAQEEDTVSFALGRSLRTQGVLLLLPEYFTSAADSLAVPSLIAAIKLGFKEYLGGDPTHLDVATVQVARTGGGAVDALLLHDQVPGGTGYLTQFTDPVSVRKLLELSWARVSSCDCQHDERLACPDCLLPYARGRAIDVTSRAAAERALRSILLNEHHPDENVDPLTRDWEIQSERAEPSESSQLELRFRILIREALAARNATIIDRVETGRPQLDFTLPGSQRWRMSEEYDKGYTRADFWFESLSGRHRPVAVFLDGAAFHISAEHFRVHGDIFKRSRLTWEEPTIMPWNLTSADLDRFDDDAADPPAWYHPEGEKLARSSKVLDPSSLRLMASSPVDLLLAYLADPEAGAWPELADAAAAHVFARRDLSPEGTLLRGKLMGRISMVATPVNRTALRAKELHLDAPAAGELSLEVWNTFLNLANLMWLSPNALSVTTNESALLSAPAQVGVEKQETKVTAEINAAWLPVLEEFEGEDDVESALRTLAEAVAVPSEVIGEELGSMSTIMIWPTQKIALLFDSEEETAEDALRKEGWILLHADSLTSNDIPETLLEH